MYVIYYQNLRLTCRLMGIQDAIDRGLCSPQFGSDCESTPAKRAKQRSGYLLDHIRSLDLGVKRRLADMGIRLPARISLIPTPGPEGPKAIVAAPVVTLNMKKTTLHPIL